MIVNNVGHPLLKMNSISVIIHIIDLFVVGVFVCFNRKDEDTFTSYRMV